MSNGRNNNHKKLANNDSSSFHFKNFLKNIGFVHVSGILMSG